MPSLWFFRLHGFHINRIWDLILDFWLIILIIFSNGYRWILVIFKWLYTQIYHNTSLWYKDEAIQKS